MIRNVTTKAGTVREVIPGTEQDYSDASFLLASAEWHRYWLRKVEAFRKAIEQELVDLDSCDVVEFKKRQAKIEVLKEIVKIPNIDVANLGK
jgi:hypothetical protein